MIIRSAPNRLHFQELLTRSQRFLIPAALLFFCLIQSGCVGTASLGLTSTNLNFGRVSIGSMGSQVLTITNSGGGPVTITQAAVSGKGFGINAPTLPITLAVGQSMHFTTTFEPAAIGDTSGTVLITKIQSTTPQFSSGSGSTATPTITTQQSSIAIAGTGVSAGPSITTQPVSQTVTVGKTATFSVTTSGAAPLSYQWMKTGIAISGATLSNYTTPSETASDGGSQFTVVVSNSTGSVTSNAATLTVNAAPGAPLQITTYLLPNAQASIPFQATLNASGGVQPYHWSLASGILPSGISLNASTGLISGTTSQGGQFDFNVQVSDSTSPSPQTAMKPLALAVLAFALQINPGSLPNGQVGVPFQTTLTGNGGVSPYTWAITGTLPTGLSLNSSSGAISGTPTQSGTSSFTVQLKDSAQQTAQKSFNITVAAAGSSTCGGVPATPSSSLASGLTLTCLGGGINQMVTIESFRQFRLVFEAQDNWGISQWYDLVNDPNAKTNLTLAYAVNGPSNPCVKQNGLANVIFYGYHDSSFDSYSAGCSFANSPRSLTVTLNSSAEIILQTVAPVSGNNNLVCSVTYYIFPDGRMYIHFSIFAAVAIDLTDNHASNNFIIDIALNDPAGGSSTAATSGWIRATATQNPYTYFGGPDTYAFSYWDPTTPTYGSFTKASIMVVPSPNIVSGLLGGQILHGWSCGTGCGTQRWGYATGNPSNKLNMSAGQTISFDYMLQLGTQGSTILPNLTSSTVAGPIANAYRANPNPPPAQTEPGGTPAPPSPGQTTLTISPSVPPVVYPGTTFKFTANAPVTWSMAPGNQGTIDADGTYHAPASVRAQQSYGGYQLLPNDHIFNTRVDSLPVNPNSAAWIAGAGTVSVSFHEISFPINYMNGSTPTQNMVFAYTPGNNGSFQIPQYPTARIESGWFSPPFSGVDRHLLSIDTTTGVFQEMYNFYNAGQNSSCASCTSQSGIRYSNSTYGLPNSQGGGVDAAGLYVMPLTLRLQEMEQAVATGGTIKHALRMTLQNGYIKFNSFIWPATATTSSGGGVVPYGARFRLKASFDISKFSAIAQTLLTQLKQYGLILADGGTGWATQPEYTRWPAAYKAAFNEIGGAGIGPSNFEAVDESGLQVSVTSGVTTNSETVIATDVTNPAHIARQQVVLTGVTITLPKDALNIQAGTSPQQFVAFISGSSNTSVTWLMSPNVGTLTSEGLYTPPANVGAATLATVTATSVADNSVAATMTLIVLPASTIRLVLGQTNPYTDTKGNVWQNEVGDDGCRPYDNGGAFPNVPDITLYKITCFGDNDIRFDIAVPNGNYQVTAKFAETETVAVGDRLMDLEANGNIVYSNVDIYASAGGMKNTPVDFTMPVTVTSGQLSFVVRHVKGDFTIISALQIAPASSP